MSNYGHAANLVEDRCQFCRTPRDLHEAAEAEGAINHKFSVDGSLVAVEQTTRPTAKIQSRVTVMIAPAPDMALRKLLVDLGVVTAEQMATVADVALSLPGQTS